MSQQEPINEQSKNKDMEPFRREAGEYLTTNKGLKVSDTNNSLKVGTRGPTLLEDFHLHEKLAHFDRERIPERVVHARGAGAHGYFQPYESLAEYTKAKIFQDPAVKTPVFVRFSTVNGFRGSADTVRDVRGFAVKFYTEEGNWDIVGNNVPVFFIQDGIKFPDLVHALKPEPHNEMPQASTAHDNFWDFISLMPESMHMIMWILSDRTIPRSFRMMQGFGVHTFRFVNAEGKGRFVKFHWKPLLGVHSLVFDEAQRIAGKDPDFHRRDLIEAIEMGDYPEYELGVQIIEEEDEFKFDFDLLDPTKIIPEEIVPVRPIGKMVLNRNPQNVFAETEQVAFAPSNVVPGIDFSNDPMLQSRLISYVDTQMHRLGNANHNLLPINRPLCPFHNNQRDGVMPMNIETSRQNYYPNSLGGGHPMPAPASEGGYVHYTQRVEGQVIRERSPSFSDHFSQATLFWNSLSDVEKEHLVEAAHFELGKVYVKQVKERMLELFNQVDHNLAERIAAGLGLPAPASEVTPNHGQRSDALSMMNTDKLSIKSRRIAILAADGVNGKELSAVKQALMEAGAHAKIVAPHGGKVQTMQGEELPVEMTFLTGASVMFDAVYVPGGAQSIETLKQQGEALHFINEAFKHCKTIAATKEGVELLAASNIQGVDLAKNGSVAADQGVVTGHGANPSKFAQTFIEALKAHRHWMRSQKQQVPA
jgi:catalase